MFIFTARPRGGGRNLWEFLVHSFSMPPPPSPSKLAHIGHEREDEMLSCNSLTKNDVTQSACLLFLSQQPPGLDVNHNISGVCSKTSHHLPLSCGATCTLADFWMRAVWKILESDVQMTENPSRICKSDKSSSYGDFSF